MVWPHDLYIGVILSSEEVIAAVRSHHVFIDRELDLSPELTVLLRAHGQSEETHKHPAEAEKLEKKRNLQLKVNFLSYDGLNR